MPAGRPTKYNEELQEKADQYLTLCLNNPKEVPFIEEIALLLDIDESTVWDWVRKTDDEDNLVFPEFSKTIKKTMLLQKARLKKLTFDRDAKVGAIFQLKVNHDMVEVNRTEHTGADGGPIKSKHEGVIVLPPLVEPDPPKNAPNTSDTTNE